MAGFVHHLSYFLDKYVDNASFVIQNEKQGKMKKNIGLRYTRTLKWNEK